MFAIVIMIALSWTLYLCWKKWGKNIRYLDE
jgi:hypothetical protein